MKIGSVNFLLAIISVTGGKVNAFAPPIHQHTRLSVADRDSSALNLNIPRLDLPGAVADKLSEFDLKNPNQMNDEEYRSYSGAAIAGTLSFFLLPGALVSGIFNDFGAIAVAIFIDFAISALIGGGLAIYLSLRGDSTGETVREYGYKVLSAVKDATGIGTLRYDLPSAATDFMTKELDLLNPNSMNEKDYDGYSGAAVAGTLAFFLLPGAFLTGAADVLGQFAGAALTDFVFSALIGGGIAIYLSLRNDEIGATVNKAGSKLLDAIDNAIGDEPKLLK